MSTHITRGRAVVSEAVCSVPLCGWQPDHYWTVDQVGKAARRHADATGHSVSLYTEQAIYVERVKR